MTEAEKREALLLRVMHLISSKYKNRIILKGGMSLRLYNSPRYTQDLDFVMLGGISRKVVAKDLKMIFAKEGDIDVLRTRLNSRGMFMDIRSGSILAQIEISMQKALHLPPDTITTAALAAPLKIPAQVITVMSRPESFSHKIAATLERKTMRDLYDLSLYEANTDFDKATLRSRLDALAVDRQQPITISYAEAAERLKKRVTSLKQDDVTTGLQGLVPEHYLTQSCEVIRNSVERLCQRLETL